MITHSDDDAVGPVKVLTGGYTWNGLNFAESIVTHKPLIGVFLGNIVATTTATGSKGVSLFKHQVPFTFGCEIDMMSEMIKIVSELVIKGLDSQKTKGMQWGKGIVVVTSETCYMPSPFRHNTLTETEHPEFN